nr:MAG TPA: hypothetical protein [Caudoviricetes sp.]DAU61522.1 MAG TPA: hypothetical protein [Caudoviricetes sp.]DAX27323.1 MAG TPA: hypothetical protein [Caudoviricetes sp.]
MQTKNIEIQQKKLLKRSENITRNLEMKSEAWKSNIKN